MELFSSFFSSFAVILTHIVAVNDLEMLWISLFDVNIAVELCS